MLMVNLIVSDTQNNLDACYLDGSKVHQSSTTIKICEHCGTAYEARRSTKRFCSDTCRVYANRPLQNAYNSPTKRRKDAEFFDAALRIGEALYALPLDQQLGYMQDLIAQAREGNSKLRQILTNRKLLKPNSVNELWLFPNGTPMYCTIAQAAKRYCWKFWKADVSDVVYCRVVEPPTGEFEF